MKIKSIIRGVLSHPHVRISIAVAAVTWGLTQLTTLVDDLEQRARGQLDEIDARHKAIAQLDRVIADDQAAAEAAGQRYRDAVAAAARAERNARQNEPSSAELGAELGAAETDCAVAPPPDWNAVDAARAQSS